MKRSACASARDSSASRKMMSSCPRFPYTSEMRLPGSRASVALVIEASGVMPLPPAISTRCRFASGFGVTVKLPEGPSTSRTSPSATTSFKRFEARPPGIRLMVIVTSAAAPSSSGRLEIE